MARFSVLCVWHHTSLHFKYLGIWQMVHDEAIVYVCNWPRAQVAVPNEVCSMPTRVRCTNSSVVLVRGAIVPSYFYHAAAMYATSKSCCVCLHLKLTVAVESEMKLYALTIVYVYKKKIVLGNALCWCLTGRFLLGHARITTGCTWARRSLEPRLPAFPTPQPRHLCSANGQQIVGCLRNDLLHRVFGENHVRL